MMTHQFARRATFRALAVACVLAALADHPALAQTAEKLKCNGCVKSKQVRNGTLKGADLKNNTVTGAKIRDGSLTGTDIKDGGVTGADVQGDSLTGAHVKNGSIGPADLAPGTALGLEGVAVIPAAAFRSGGGTSDDYVIYFDGGYVRGTDTGLGCVGAPIHLPDGVTITELEVFIADNDAAKDVTLYLQRSDFINGGTKNLGSVSTAGSLEEVRRFNLPNVAEPIVDLSTFAYYVWTCLSSRDTKLHAVRVLYD